MEYLLVFFLTTIFKAEEDTNEIKVQSFPSGSLQSGRCDKNSYRNHFTKKRKHKNIYKNTTGEEYKVLMGLQGFSAGSAVKNLPEMQEN